MKIPSANAVVALLGLIALSSAPTGDAFARDVNGCSHTTRREARHAAPVIDTGITFAFKSSTGADVSTFEPNAAYTVWVYPSEGRSAEVMFTASSGTFGGGTRCSGRRKDLAPSRSTFSMPFTAPGSGNVEFIAMASRGERFGLLRNAVTVPVKAAAVVATPAPTPAPTVAATLAPTRAPTLPPTASPTPAPTVSPTPAPTPTPSPPPPPPPLGTPNAPPTAAPTATPTLAPTPAPTDAPTDAPTAAPTAAPTLAATDAPTDAPTGAPTGAPTPAFVDAASPDPLAAPAAGSGCPASDLGLACTFPLSAAADLHWSLREAAPGAPPGDQLVDIAMSTSEPVDWLSIGWTPDEWMVPGDAVIGVQLPGGGWDVAAYAMVGYGEEDVFKDVSHEIQDASVEVVGGRTILRFARRLDNGAPVVLSAEAAVNFQWGVGTVGAFNSQGQVRTHLAGPSYRGVITVGLKDGTAGAVTDPRRVAIVIHGVLMMAAWVGLVPLGQLLAHFLRHRSCWLWCHKVCMVLALGLSGGSMVLAARDLMPWSNDGPYHSVSGSLALVGAVLQAAGGALRPAPGTHERVAWAKAHRASGIFIYAVAAYSLVTGLILMKKVQELPISPWAEAWVGATFFLGFLAVLMITDRYFAEKRHEGEVRRASVEGKLAPPAPSSNRESTGGVLHKMVFAHGLKDPFPKRDNSSATERTRQMAEYINTTAPALTSSQRAAAYAPAGGPVTERATTPAAAASTSSAPASTSRVAVGERSSAGNPVGHAWRPHSPPSGAPSGAPLAIQRFPGVGVPQRFEPGRQLPEGRPSVDILAVYAQGARRPVTPSNIKLAGLYGTPPSTAEGAGTSSGYGPGVSAAGRHGAKAYNQNVNLGV